MSTESGKTAYQKIAIPLRGFERKHGPIDKLSGTDEFGEKGSFVGRSQLISSLNNLLKKTRGKRGTYLIAGYRGSGKTSLINYVINNYNKNENNPNKEEKNKKQDDEKIENRGAIKVVLNLGNDNNLTPIKLFYSVANILLDEFRKKRGKVGGITPQLSKILFNIGMFISLFVILALWTKYFGDGVLLREIPLLHNIPLLCDASLLSVFVALLLFLFLGAWVSIYCFLRQNADFLRIENRLKYLIERISYETTRQATIGNKSTPFSFMKGRKSQPVHAREAEEILVSIISEISNLSKKIKYEVIFVFDEIDKLSRFEDSNGHSSRVEVDDAERIHNINQLLGSIKYFITTCNAKFFIIAGRETLDSYYSEKGSSNSLYESLFDSVYEVPSLLTDDGSGTNQTQISKLIEEYLCKAIAWDKAGKEKEYNLKHYFIHLNDTSGPNLSTKDCRHLVSQLRSFVSYLAFHSWGNPKRLSALFESFVVPGKHIKNNKDSYETFGYDHEGDAESSDWLSISINDKRSFSLASEIFTLFQHHLSREVSKTSDKLTVSALSSLHFILKLHPYGFTRESLHRMSEAINIYRSPELNTIVDDLLSQILKSYIRRVRNGSYRYRFNSGLEQELRYISHVNELESASYNFSLNSMEPVKKAFKKYILDNSDLNEETKAKLYMTLGDMCTIEQSYNSAAINYGIARSFIENIIKRTGGMFGFDSAMLFCELGIKHGDLEERRQNYNYAASIYSDIETFVCGQLRTNQSLREAVLSGDSKWDMFKQAAWANMFLSLKRSPASSIIKNVSYMYSNNDFRMYSRRATLNYFMGDLEDATECYLKAVGSGINANIRDEKNTYIKGNSLVGLAEVCLMRASQSIMASASESSQDKEVRLKIMTMLGQFIERPALDNLPGKNRSYYYAPRTDRYFGIRKPILSPSAPYQRDFFVNLRQAANSFEQSGLYISATISHLKIISYWAIILDFYVKKDIDNDDDLKKKVSSAFNEIDSSGRKAIKCIVLARQLDSSQFAKTFIIRDQPSNLDNECLVNLFDLLLGDDENGKENLNESIVWQQSLWAHKLASTLCWANLVRKKLLGKGNSRIDKYPEEMSFLSVRSSITMRWVISRDMLNNLMIDKEIISESNESGAFDLLTYLNLMQNKDSVQLDCWGTSLANPFSKNGDKLQEAYQISRNLYFSLQSIRLISRKNLDLVYPNMAQIYFLQWKLLSMLVTIHMIRDYTLDGQNKISSIRSYALEIQKKLIDADECFAPNERIPPTHFEYEHILMRAKSNLIDAMNINDPSSRVRSSILQQKHYCHDDHSDPEFRLDWTLAHIFSPSACYLIDHIDNTHKKLIELSKVR